MTDKLRYFLLLSGIKIGIIIYAIFLFVMSIFLVALFDEWTGWQTFKKFSFPEEAFTFIRYTFIAVFWFFAALIIINRTPKWLIKLKEKHYNLSKVFICWGWLFVIDFICSIGINGTGLVPFFTPELQKILINFTFILYFMGVPLTAAISFWLMPKLRLFNKILGFTTFIITAYGALIMALAGIATSSVFD